MRVVFRRKGYPEKAKRATTVIESRAFYAISFCVGMEQRSLEEMLEALMEEVTNNVKTLQLLDKQLLDRLSGKRAWILH